MKLVVLGVFYKYSFKLYFFRQTDELSQCYINHLRYIDQIFNSKLLFNLVFEKKINLWHSPLRESFIEILPEIFIDQNIHHGIKKIKHFMNMFF